MMSDRDMQVHGQDGGNWDAGALSRRQFFQAGFLTVNAATGLILTGIATRFLVGNSLESQSNQWVELGATATFAAGEMHQVKYNVRAHDLWREIQRLGLVYVHTEDGRNFTVLDATCTHLGCNVRWQADRDRFSCPCHNGHFTREGAVISGPPPNPLKQLQTRVEDGTLSFML